MKHEGTYVPPECNHFQHQMHFISPLCSSKAVKQHLLIWECELDSQVLQIICSVSICTWGNSLNWGAFFISHNSGKRQTFNILHPHTGLLIQTQTLKMTGRFLLLQLEITSEDRNVIYFRRKVWGKWLSDIFILAFYWLFILFQYAIISKRLDDASHRTKYPSFIFINISDYLTPVSCRFSGGLAPFQGGRQFRCLMFQMETFHREIMFPCSRLAWHYRHYRGNGTKGD